jgi:hypothetical protein
VDLPIKFGGNENGRGTGERMVVDPNDHDVVLCGTRRYGLWRSADAGATWDEYGRFPVREEPLGVGITFVTFDARSGAKGKPTPVVYARAFASTETGLYRSEDAGKDLAGGPLVSRRGLMPATGELDAAGDPLVELRERPRSERRRGWGRCTSTSRRRTAGRTWTPVLPKGDDRFGYGGTVGGTRSTRGRR